MNFLKTFNLLIILMVCLMLSACGDDGSKVQPVKPAVKKAVAPVAQAVAVEEVSPEPVYIYSPSGKRDPFESPFNIIVEVSPETGVPLTPLQKFDLGQLRLIGVIIGKGEPRGMVIGPEGKSFILKKGTKVGKNDGSVVEITTDAVFIKEKYMDFSGEVRSKVQEIMLPKQGGVQ